MIQSTGEVRFLTISLRSELEAFHPYRKFARVQNQKDTSDPSREEIADLQMAHISGAVWLPAKLERAIESGTGICFVASSLIERMEVAISGRPLPPTPETGWGGKASVRFQSNIDGIGH